MKIELKIARNQGGVYLQYLLDSRPLHFRLVGVDIEESALLISSLFVFNIETVLFCAQCQLAPGLRNGPCADPLQRLRKGLLSQTRSA